MKLQLPSTTHTLLIVEDDMTMIKLYKRCFDQRSFNLKIVQTGTEALEYLKQQTPSTILLDLGLPDINGKEVLNYVKQHSLNCPVIVVTWQDSVGVTVELMQAGAFNYLEKPVPVERLQVTVHNAIRQYELQHYIESQLERDRYHGMLGACKSMQTVYRTIDLVANSPVDILITGESGTGKELCANALHRASQRATHPFIIVNCAAIPENLIESQLFGHVKGAFTGATEDRDGTVSQANQGTLFFDEIGELNLTLQKVLLRFVQTKTFQKVGSNQSEQVDTRIICATNRDLAAEVKAGRFREDLYYRLNVVQINLPSLRDRGEDILLLARMFLQLFSQRENKTFQTFTPTAEQQLLQYRWPGNIRQLQNVIQNVVIFHQGPLVTTEMLKPHLPKEVENGQTPSGPAKSTPVMAPSTATSMTTSQHIQSLEESEKKVSVTSNQRIRSFDEIEKEVVLATIEHCQGDVVQAANSLEIGVSTIYRKLRDWNISTKQRFPR